MRRYRGLVGLALVVAAGTWLAPASAAGADTLSVQCSPAPAAGGCDESGAWQTTPVTVTWEVVPAPTQVSGCASQTYADTATTVSCHVWWGPNGTLPDQSISFPLNVEVSTPTAAATPSRSPDANGWYNHPVTVSVQGAAFSGIASCTPLQTYAGPATAATTVGGSCTDNAGKTASAGLGLRYDATPPSLTASVSAAVGVVNLSWRAAASPAPIALVQVSRSPGVGGAPTSVVYQGVGAADRDDEVRNGVTYRYTITAADQAGNVTTQTVVATPGARLLAPAAGARLSGPPTLHWTSVPHATYYNVQLFGHGKVLSSWPTRASLRLTRTWWFHGRRHHLARGRYRWYVWPGFGPRRAARYGHVVGTATFVVA